MLNLFVLHMKWGHFQRAGKTIYRSIKIGNGCWVGALM